MAYLPDRGHAVWITLNPQAGHEQAGRRPAVVLSPAAYNGKVGLAIAIPSFTINNLWVRANDSVMNTLPYRLPPNTRRAQNSGCDSSIARSTPHREH